MVCYGIRAQVITHTTVVVYFAGIPFTLDSLIPIRTILYHENARTHTQTHSLAILAFRCLFCRWYVYFHHSMLWTTYHFCSCSFDSVGFFHAIARCNYLYRLQLQSSKIYIYPFQKWMFSQYSDYIILRFCTMWIGRDFISRDRVGEMEIKTKRTVRKDTQVHF